MEGEWTRFLSDATGWTVTVALTVMIARALLRGDLVIGREYDRLNRQLDEMTKRAEALAETQRREAAEERIRMLAQIAELQRQTDETR